MIYEIVSHENTGMLPLLFKMNLGGGGAGGGRAILSFLKEKFYYIFA